MVRKKKNFKAGTVIVNKVDDELADRINRANDLLNVTKDILIIAGQERRIVWDKFAEMYDLDRNVYVYLYDRITKSITVKGTVEDEEKKNG